MVTASHQRILLILAIIFVASFSLFGGMVAAQDTTVAVCPSGQGYWKNHTEVWPVTDLMLGSQMYTQLELIGLLNLPPQGDASLILAHQLIAAKLNIAAGADPTAVSGMVAQADALLAAFPNRLPFGVAPSSTEGNTMTGLSGVLDVFNNGGLTVGCMLTASPTATFTPPVAGPTATPTYTPTVATATPTFTPSPGPSPTAPPTVTGVPPLPDDEGCVIEVQVAKPVIAAKEPAQIAQEATPEVTPEPGINIDGGPGNDTIIVVEGPVEEINVNVVNIYDIDIALNPTDPLLNVIQIGDVIRVEGDIDHDCPTLVVIAVVVIFVDVDVVIIDSSHVWRDTGDCSNGPPPWAPAHGWRRRCEGGGGNGGGSGGGMGMGGGSGS
jgi:hypothetical protein